MNGSLIQTGPRFTPRRFSQGGAYAAVSLSDLRDGKPRRQCQHTWETLAHDINFRRCRFCRRLQRWSETLGFWRSL